LNNIIVALIHYCNFSIFFFFGGPYFVNGTYFPLNILHTANHLIGNVTLQRMHAVRTTLKKPF
jgi:hypothetical protein